MEFAGATDLFDADTDTGAASGSGVGLGSDAGTDPFAATAAGTGSLAGTATTAGSGGVWVPWVDEPGLSDEGLRARVGLVGRAESRLAAMKSRALAELGRRHSAGVAQRVARDELQSSSREAKRDVEAAVQLVELPATSEALESGEIPQGHARLIARASGEGDIDEAVLVEAAGDQDYDEFAKTVRRHQQDRAKDDGQSIVDRQRKKRSARIFESPETGMFVLSGQFDQITGTRIATALTAKDRELWHNEDPKNRRTPQQRMADALVELVLETGNGKTQGTNLLVIADYDVIKQELVKARLADGTAIAMSELRRLARDADILPGIFDAKTQNMWLGRQRRTASEAQRVALIARDQGCIGCGANPLWCRSHHIIWWSKNGPTDFDNLLLVCDGCHQKIHKLGWQVHQHPDTHKFHLKPPNPGADQQRPPASFADYGNITIRLTQPNTGRGEVGFSSDSFAGDGSLMSRVPRVDTKRGDLDLASDSFAGEGSFMSRVPRVDTLRGEVGLSSDLFVGDGSVTCRVLRVDIRRGDLGLSSDLFVGDGSVTCRVPRVDIRRGDLGLSVDSFVGDGSLMSRVPRVETGGGEVGLSSDSFLGEGSITCRAPPRNGVLASRVTVFATERAAAICRPGDIGYRELQSPPDPFREHGADTYRPSQRNPVLLC